VTNGFYLRFFALESDRHHGVLVYEWLLEAARRLGIPGGSAFVAIAGFGREHTLHEEAFFELAGKVPVEIAFAVRAEQAEQLLAHVREAGLDLVYIKSPAEFGTVLETSK
jgi:PII-like signaling protein